MAINIALDFGWKEKHTLYIEEHSIDIEVWPLEHAPKFRNLVPSVRCHCMGVVSVTTSSGQTQDLHCLSSPMNTIFLSVVLYLANIGK